jgi:hypothetical protein
MSGALQRLQLYMSVAWGAGLGLCQMSGGDSQLTFRTNQFDGKKQKTQI